jgi:hypothetical protein
LKIRIKLAEDLEKNYTPFKYVPCPGIVRIMTSRLEPFKMTGGKIQCLRIRTSGAEVATRELQKRWQNVEENATLHRHTESRQPDRPTDAIFDQVRIRAKPKWMSGVQT